MSKKKVDKKVINKKNIKKVKLNDEGQEISTINRFNILFVDIQMVLTILTIIVFVMYLFNSKMMGYLQLSLGLSLIVMGYNNYKIYKRPKASIVYVLVGVFLLVLDLLTVIG